MKVIVVVLASLMLAACATEHRPPINQLSKIAIDCTNRDAFEIFYKKQLTLTDYTKVSTDKTESSYYSAIKEKQWTLRSVCQ